MDVSLHADLQEFPPQPDPDDNAHAFAARRRRQGILLVVALLVLGCAVIGATLVVESRESPIQAKYLSRYAEKLDYEVMPGASNAIGFPQQGPFDERLGYAQLPELLQRLQERGMAIEAQSRFSPALLEYTSNGFFAPYSEKSQAGLELKDCRGEALYRFSYPHQGYASFESIPPVVVQGLLFIENRGLLDPGRPRLNPAVDWGRFTKAAFYQSLRALGLDPPAMGGSTLATQIEKYRHSPDGRTASNEDKLQQMISASVRAYRYGPETEATRRALVLSYLNTVPLSAAPGHGEVHGLADGLRVWFNTDFSQVNDLLAAPAGEGKALILQGQALRRVLALMIAQRRPSWYLAGGREELHALTGSYLRLMAAAGEIGPSLRDAALAQSLDFRDFRTASAVTPMLANKGVNVARSRLTRLLDVSLYELDRLDLSASATIHSDLQAAVTAYLSGLRDPALAAQAGLIGQYLLKPGQTRDLRYSFTLFERTPDGNRVRVQTDNTDQPFDINEGSKLELGSTAKLRVLATYLEVIAELHGRYAGRSREALAAVTTHPQDHLARWVINHLAGPGDPSLAGTLRAAVERRYSASPHEAFFTGGGLHRFNNFRKEDNGRNPTVREAMRESLNLPFVRMMNDIVRYTIHQRMANSDQLLKDDADPRRQEYLKRFADREGIVFLQRFWRKHQGKATEERLETFLGGLRQTPVRLAAVHRYVFPDATQEEFSSFLRTRRPEEILSDARLGELYRQYGPGRYSLPDQGYVAGVHPLELWVINFLIDNPTARFSDAIAASQVERQEVYGWLLRTRAKNARDSRIRTMLEVEAFLDIHLRWRRLGYPFDHLVPSLATALGSSGDRPAALAELMGIIVNGGIRQETLRIDGLAFAVDTPYETRLSRTPTQAEQVMLPEVAAQLQELLAAVVDDGTARRLQGAFILADGSRLAAGGKTGTGDNRIVTVSAGGQRGAGRALSRTATFVFYLGPNHFGTLTAFVPGQMAAEFRFTSALPVQVLKGMAPVLLPHLQPHLSPDAAGACRDASYRQNLAELP